MTTSGDVSFNPAVTEIIAQSLFQLGVNAEDEAPTASQYKTAIFQLNAVVTAAQATGLHVWTEEEGILFLQAGQAMYEIGGPTPARNAHTADENEWARMVLSHIALPGATTITVEEVILSDPAPAVPGLPIGVILDNGVTHWTTATSVAANVITLADPLPLTASPGSYALTYAAKINRPLKLPAARLLYLNNLNEIPMLVNSRQEYMDTPNKFTNGPPTQFFYSPRRDKGLIYIWPVPMHIQYAVRFTWYRPLQDFFQPNDTMDFPQEWISPLMWMLAKDLMGIYDTPPQRQQYIAQQATAYAELALNYDRESEPIQFGYDYMGGS